MTEISSTFILRLWTRDEPLTGGARLSQGRIDHVQSGHRLYFDQLAVALDFLREHFGAYGDLEGSPDIGTGMIVTTPPSAPEGAS